MLGISLPVNFMLGVGVKMICASLTFSLEVVVPVFFFNASIILLEAKTAKTKIIITASVIINLLKDIISTHNNVRRQGKSSLCHCDKIITSFHFFG